MKMPQINAKRVLAATAALSIAIGAGAAIAASNGSSPDGKSFLDRVADHLGISTEKLEDATKAAAIDQVDAELEAGRITKEQADELKERIREGEAPFFFGGPHKFGGPDFGYGPERHMVFGGPLRSAAEYLDLTVPQLMEKLASGKTLAEVARDEDKSVDGLKQAMLADAKERLDEAVEDGLLTQAQANEKLDAYESKLDEIVTREFPGPEERFEHHWRGGPPEKGGWILPPAA